MNEELKRLIQEARSQGATDNDIKRIIDMYVADEKKKGSSKPTAQEEPLESPTRTLQQNTSSDTDQQTRAQASVALGGPTKLFDPLKGLIDTQQEVINRVDIKPKTKTDVANKAYDYAISNLDKQKSLDRLNDEEDNYQLLDNLSRSLKTIYNVNIANPLGALNNALGGDKDYFAFKEYIPLEREKKQYINQIKQEKGNKYKASEEEILKGARDIYLYNDKQDQLHQLIDEALPSGYDREGLWKELKIKEINSNDLLRSRIVSAEVFKSELIEFNNIAKEIKSGNATQEQIDNFNKSKEKAIVAIDGLNWLKNNYEKLVQEAKTDNEKLELFKYNYNDFEKFPSLLDGSTKNIVGGTAKILADTSKYLNEKTGDYNNPVAMLFSDVGSELLKESETQTAPFYRYKASKIDNWSDFGSITTQLTSEQIPVLASIYFGGNLGIAAVSAGSGGQKIFELEEQAKQPFGKIYSDGEKLAAGWLYAGAEFIPERLGTARILKDIERTISSASKVSRKMFMDSFFKNTFKGLGSVAYATGLEGGTELITAESQINIDKELLGIVKTGAENNELRSESFFSGALMGGGMALMGGSVGFAVSQSRLYSERKDIKAVRDLLSNIDVLNKEIENNKTLNDQEKTSIYQEINNLNNKAFSIVEKNSNKGLDLSIKAKSFLLDVNQRQSDIINNVEEIKKSNYSKEIKRQKLEDLKREFSSLEDKRNSTLQGGYNRLTELSSDEIIRLKDKASRELMKELNPDGTKTITINDSEITKRAIQILDSETKAPVVQEMSVKPSEAKAEKVKPAEVTEEKIDNRPVAERQAEAESKIKRKDLFMGVGEFSSELGGSDKSAVPVSHKEKNGIEFVEYAHPETGSVDVIVTGKTDNDFVGFYRIYENGKPTNKWSSKFENQSRNKEDFKTMISGVQEMLPEGHEYTEKTSISTDGLRVWNQQLEKGYEIQTDEKGDIVTNKVAINGDAIVNELGVDVNKGNFENIRITKEQFETVKKALLPYLEKLGLNESNIRFSGENVSIPGVKGSVQIDLPVLRKTKKEASPTETKAEVAPEAKVKTIGTNSITSIDVVDEYNDMTKQYRDKKKAITLLARDNKITTKEADSLTKELFKNLKEAKSTPKTTTVVEAKASETTTEVAPNETTAIEEIAPSEIETTLDEVITPASNNIKEQIARAKKAISKFLPNVEIVYHTTAESFQAVVGDNSRGYYDTETKKIHVNGSNASKTTVAHEVFHAVILKYISSDKQATDLTNRMFKALAKSIKNNPKLLKDINKFAESYSKGLQSEEKLAEVIGYLASEYETLPDVSKNIIQKWIEKIAKMVGIKKFTDQEVVDFMNTIATKVAYGQEITEADVKAINQGSSTYIAEPTEINRYQKVKEEKVKVGDHKLSFVKESDLIDMDSLMKEISDKKEKVWFWVADQLGRGDYYDSVIDGEHYLDAGPSFALDPENRSKNIIWATGKAEKEITKLIGNSDYIFIISGSPLKSKLFNKSIIDIISKRAGDFNSFKKNILNASKIKPLNDVLSSVNSWEELRDTPKRKEFLLNVLNQADKNTPLKKELEKYNSIIDLNELRDGFYADNNFELNDIMLVLKPTEFGGKSNHSTYENNILGEVIGVPDIKVNAFDILPSEIKDKYKGELGKSQQQQAVAPYGIGVRPIERKQKEISPENSSNYANMTEDGKGNFVFYHFGPRGIKSIDPKKYGSNKGAITSKPEIAAMGRVGGMSQFYTMPEYQESNVSGDKYMIKVPMDKVYDFNTDPENFYDRAREMFKAKHPDLPFTANDQLAYITKLADKAGYDMTVAEWNNMSRAQSTKALKPVDTQVMDGNVISKPFQENYESNSAKGFESVIPTSKKAKLKDVYQKINAERNAKNRYDSLYSLAEDFPKLSQDKITDMIESSDISQEMKDAYAEALAYEPGARMSGRRQVSESESFFNEADEVFPNDHILGGYAVTDKDGKLIGRIKLSEVDNNTVKIDEVVAEKKGERTGNGSAIMNMVTDIADKNNVTLTLTPNLIKDIKAKGFETAQKLQSFYEKFNFIKDKGKATMTRIPSQEGRSQKSPIDIAVSTAKTKGFNDKTIIDYLIKKGYTRAQATNAVLRYNSEVSVKAMKSDSVFTREGRNKVVTFLDSMKRRWLSAKGFLPKSIFIFKEKIESNIKAETKRASYLVDEFNKLVKNYDGDLDVLESEADKYLRGEDANIPDEFKAVIGKMRIHIDNLSQMLLKNGAVSLSQAETIAKNLGQYVNRSYKVFDKSNWSKQVTEEMKEAARTDLRKIYRPTAEIEASKTGMDVDIILEDFINKKIDELINNESAATFLGIGKTGSKDLSIMKQKTDIPLSIRQLMGEYTDASQNYARTVLKIATFAENARYLKSARDAGMGVFFYDKNDLNRPDEFNTPIASEGSETMSPLNGLMTTPEIANAFKNKISSKSAIDAWFGSDIGGAISKAYETYMKVLSTVKWMKTIASVATHSKNVTGNIWFMLSNGYVNPKNYAVSFNTLKNSTNEELRDKLDEFIRAGIIDQSAALGEIKAMFSDADFDTAIDNRLKKNPIEKAKSKIKKTKDFLNRAYQLEDDFFKIISYESEKNRRSEAYFNKPFNELTDDQKLIVTEESSEITKNVLPNYGRIPNIVKITKIIPVIGTFVSFQAEAYRTAWNTVALAGQELKSDNKKIKSIGAKRLAGIVASQSLKYGLMALIGTAIRGGDDDDDDDQAKYAKMFVAPWSKDSDIVLLNDYGDGKMSYIDFSASDPHGGIKKAYNSMMAGDGFIESFANGMKQIFEPFVKEDILMQAITDVASNKNPYGGKLYNEKDTDINKIKVVYKRFWDVLEPGTLKSVMKISESENLKNEIIGQMTGYKVMTVDVNKQLGFKMSDLKDEESEARRLYNSAVYKFNENKISKEELDSAYNQANTEQKDVYLRMIDNMKAASFFGANDYDITMTMKDNGLSKSTINSLWYGETPELKTKTDGLTDEEIKQKNPELYKRMKEAESRMKDKLPGIYKRGQELLKKINERKKGAQ